jgi:hypothetical protein
MDAIVTLFIALMPLFAVAPLALAAVVAVALLVSPRSRDTLTEWMRRRLRLDAPAEPSPSAREVEELRREVRRLEERLGFVERVVTLQPRPAAPRLLPNAGEEAPRPTTPRPA